jgi:hypothetical protein
MLLPPAKTIVPVDTVAKTPDVFPVIAPAIPPPPPPGLTEAARLRPTEFKVTERLMLVPAVVVPVPANLVDKEVCSALLVIALVFEVCWKREDWLVFRALAVILEVLLVY